MIAFAMRLIVLTKEVLMQMKKRCCFAGHSQLHNKSEIYVHLIKLIKKLITEDNVSEFIVGNYGQFDALASKAVQKLKENYPKVELTLVIPYLTRDIDNCKERYYKNFDNILIANLPEKTPQKLKILKCNEYMVDTTDFLICYIEHNWGGASKTMEYAKKNRHIKLFNIAHY